MMGVEAPETCWATHKRQVMNLWNCCILSVNLFELYDDARTCQRQIDVMCRVVDVSDERDISKIEKVAVFANMSLTL